MTSDRYRPLTAAAVLLVAAIAAVVSYMHVATLALRYGQPPLAAYLLPLSIDGLVASSGEGPRDVLTDVLSVFGSDAGLQWGDVAARLASRFPARWEGVTADAISAECRERGVPSVNVKVGGATAKGCRRDAVEAAAGAQ